MAALKSLMATSQLKTTYLKRFAGSGLQRLFVNYDDDFDALMILFVPPDTETVVHYVDEYVALLYQPKNHEIVGLQVESFERNFVPAHASVKKVWRLSKATESKLQDVGDMMLVVEQMKPKVAQEVVKAAPHLPTELKNAVLA